MGNQRFQHNKSMGILGLQGWVSCGRGLVAELLLNPSKMLRAAVFVEAPSRHSGDALHRTRAGLSIVLCALIHFGLPWRPRGQTAAGIAPPRSDVLILFVTSAPRCPETFPGTGFSSRPSGFLTVPGPAEGPWMPKTAGNLPL